MIQLQKNYETKNDFLQRFLLPSSQSTTSASRVLREMIPRTRRFPYWNPNESAPSVMATNKAFLNSSYDS